MVGNPSLSSVSPKQLAENERLAGRLERVSEGVVKVEFDPDEVGWDHAVNPDAPNESLGHIWRVSLSDEFIEWTQTIVNDLVGQPADQIVGYLDAIACRLLQVQRNVQNALDDGWHSIRQRRLGTYVVNLHREDGTTEFAFESEDLQVAAAWADEWNRDPMHMRAVIHVREREVVQ